MFTNFFDAMGAFTRLANIVTGVLFLIGIFVTPLLWIVAVGFLVCFARGPVEAALGLVH